MNFRPFNNKLVWVSVKFFLERFFFIKLALLFVRELFDSFLHSLCFFVFVCVIIVSLDFALLALSSWFVLTHNSVKKRTFYHF